MAMESRMFQTPPQRSTAKIFAGSKRSSKWSSPQNKQHRENDAVLGTPKSFSRSTSSGCFSSLPVVDTPPPPRGPKVINPFEYALTDRLHLPFICSPSLFQRPNTPQHSSTQFEWTIEEVSSLGPANVEAHETQFQATPDPVLEARAQAAISSYFKDQIIVPSPVECPLRNRKIVLTNILNSNSPPVRSGRRTRDGVAQTIMSIPPIVAPEIEEVLAKFLTYTSDQQQSPTVPCDITVDYEAQDMSLRRKLFGFRPMNVGPNEELDGRRNNGEAEEEGMYSDADISEIHTEHSPPPKSPDLQTNPIPERGFCTPFANNSFGELSPISKPGSKQNTPKRLALDDEILNDTIDVDEADFNFDNDENVFKSTQQSPRTSTGNNNRQDHPNNEHNQSLYRSTPDRSMVQNMSVDRSFNVNDITRQPKNLFPRESENISEKSFFAIDDENDMQISQLSAKSIASNTSSSSSQHSDTPVRRRNRSVSRKNLSRSFSCPVTTDDEDDDNAMDGIGGAALFLFKRVATTVVIDGKTKTEVHREQQSERMGVAMVDASESLAPIMHNSTERSVLHRTDSGFNEMTTHDEYRFRSEMDDLKENAEMVEGDVSMTC